MEIAKNIQASEYLRLDLSNFSNTDWTKAVDIMVKRLNERFIEPADALVSLENNVAAKDKKFGFSILALDFLLCETLQAFYEGITDSTGHSKRLFKAFLMQRSNFKEYFQTEIEAGEFYKKFRCGILHQAQTSVDTKVWSIGKLIFKENNYTIVNREQFHNNLKLELEEYSSLLNSKKDELVLKNFKIKMDFIANG